MFDDEQEALYRAYELAFANSTGPVLGDYDDYTDYKLSVLVDYVDSMDTAWGN